MNTSTEFWTRVDKSGGEEACWPWTRGHSEGYGRVWWRGGFDYAHRVAYRLTKGTIPDSFQIDHLCRNRSCCNPRHLEAVTQAENKRRGVRDRISRPRPEQCPRGHPYDEANTYTNRRGGRHCRECGRISSRRTYYKNLR